jgi:hypothetical protein
MLQDKVMMAVLVEPKETLNVVAVVVVPVLWVKLVDLIQAVVVVQV